MPQIYCHNCRVVSMVPSSWNGRCHLCNDDFVEVTEAEVPGAIMGLSAGSRQGRGRAAAAASRPTNFPNFEEWMAMEMGIEHNQLNAMMMARLFGGGGMGHDWMQQIADMLMQEYEPPNHPTAERIRKCLPTLRVRDGDPASEPGEGEAFACAGEPCSVCHDEFIAGAKVTELPCSHCFHKDCLSPWLETHNTCPICRIELPEEQ